MNMSTSIPLENQIHVDDQDATSAANSEHEHNSLQKKIRTKSLLLASFPWFTSLPMVDSKIADILHKEEDYGYHLARALDNYDSFLVSQSIHNSPLKAILRDVDADSMSGMSTTAITNRESSMLKSKEKGNELCSLLCAFRLLDIIVNLEILNDQAKPPVHKKMEISFSKNEKSLRSFANWTTILKKFRVNFKSSQKNTETNESASNLPTQQLQALFRLHSSMNIDKSLINLQLAATHISFMLQLQSKKNVIPDFPGTIGEFSLLYLMRNPSTEDGINFFPAFLEKLAGEKHQIDNLRLPLQVALLVSPLFLLQDAQIHLSTFYNQRYKMTLYSKALGNERPDAISDLEKFIWRQLFDIANGTQTVHEAASKIADHIPENFDHMSTETCDWFMLDPIANKKDPINMSSFSIKEGTIPHSWPLAEILETGNALIPSQSLINSGKRTRESREQNNQQPTLRPRKKRRMRSSTNLPQERSNTSHKKSIPKKGRQYSVLSRPSFIITAQNLPLVVRNMFVKGENVEVKEELNSNDSTEYVLLPENTLVSSSFTAHFHTFNIHGERLDHEFSTPFEKLATAVRDLTTKIDNNFTFGTHGLCIEYDSTSKIKPITCNVAREMSPSAILNSLRSKHIIVADYNLPSISCDRNGLMSISSLKELVKIEDALQVKDGVLGQFVDNLELDIRNTLRIIRMKSYFGAEPLPFASDQAALRDTGSDPYCVRESSELSSLRWTDVATAHTIQPWRIAPTGFGMFFDVRSGKQLVIIATPGNSHNDALEFFSQWDHLLQDFDQLNPEFCSNSGINAIRLEPGNRLILHPNTPYIVITLENAIVTGGFYLSTHALYKTLIGKIHSFVLPSLLTEGGDPPFSFLARRIVHYMHNAYVKNDASNRGHLLSLSTLDDVRDLLSLIAIAIFLNVFDERTYLSPSDTLEDDPIILQQCHTVFDLNAIPIAERNHLCYTRGLALDLLNWFFENYTFSSTVHDESDIDAYSFLFVPFLVHIGRKIIRYKRHAESCGYTTPSTSNEVSHQVQLALFGFEAMRDAWIEAKNDENEKDYEDDENSDHFDNPERNDLNFDFEDCTIVQRVQPESRHSSTRKLLEDGKTKADERFFRGLASRFNLKEFEQLENEDSDFLSS